MARFLSTPEICRMLGVRWWQIEYAVKRGVVTPEKIGGRRQFAGDDILTLRAWFEQEGRMGRKPQRVEPTPATGEGGAT